MKVLSRDKQVASVPHINLLSSYSHPTNEDRGTERLNDLSQASQQGRNETEVKSVHRRFKSHDSSRCLI